MNVLVSSLDSCPDLLSEDQIKQFRRDGFLAFADVISPEEVEASREALKTIVRDLSSDPQSIYTPPRDGESGNHCGASYKRSQSRSFIQFEAGFDPKDQAADALDAHIRKYMWFSEESPVFEKIVSPGSRLHRVVEALIGANPILFQDMALVKPAFIGTEKPWHQDNAYFSIEPLEAVVGVWLALDDAEVENGCMHVIPGGHLVGAFKHHHGRDCEIDAALLPVDNAVPVPVPAGGAMFFYGMLPHQPPPINRPIAEELCSFITGGRTAELSTRRFMIDCSWIVLACRLRAAPRVVWVFSFLGSI